MKVGDGTTVPFRRRPQAGGIAPVRSTISR